jgi:ABC-type sugar transport system ATPase subunit
MLKDLNYEDIVRLMIGTPDVGSYFRRHSADIGDTVFSVKDLGRQGVLRTISHQSCIKEILGLWGLMGSVEPSQHAILGLELDR